ncbi:MAG TPA: hypothetical protein VE650_00430 [Acetobacteraceae bacterium]|nr:hypothetical protein [Acetobacteraceae bacterium]
MARVFSGHGSYSVDELSKLAMQDLAPKLAAERGLIRYATISYSDGQFGSFSVYDTSEAARRGAQIASEWVKSRPEMQAARLERTMEGEVVFAARGPAEGKGRLHAIARLYTTDASLEDIKQALERDAGQMIRSFQGLARYTAAKLTDGRLGVFSAFDTEENARKSSEQAKSLRMRGDTKLAQLLASDPEVIEGTVMATYVKEHAPA